MFVPEREHWIATACSSTGKVCVYDSSFTGRLTHSTEEQLVRFYKPLAKNGALMVTMVPVQQQLGSVDCGLFAIAFAFSAAREDSFSRLSFHQQGMRDHLVQCFQQQQLQPFPASQKRKEQKNRLKHIQIHLYCTCGLPESSDTQMIQCAMCQQWYHFRCMGIKDAPEHWNCPTCIC